jgi:dTDP-glucose 4,6-dehydratase
MPERHDMTLLITGGAGFIGSHLADLALARGHRVVVLDALTYAGSLGNLEAARRQPGFTFVKGDIGDRALVADLLAAHQVGRVFHLAAESHVDNSITGPEPFLRTNVDGTFQLLEACPTAWERGDRQDGFRFVHVSTDEVFGDLGPDDPPFDETTPYRPSSPYSASKAASDLFARAWFRTFGLPVVVTNCSNNFGPRQHGEKLIPTMIRCALAGRPLPVYGDGRNVRDWLYVNDHCRGLLLAGESGQPGETYCLGGGTELPNIELVRLICTSLDALRPRPDERSYAEQIAFVTDRPGHDRRYAIDGAKAQTHLGYKAETSLAEGLRETIRSFVADAERAPVA